MANNAAHNTATTEPLDRATPDVSLNVAAVAAGGKTVTGTGFGAAPNVVQSRTFAEGTAGGPIQVAAPAGELGNFSYVSANANYVDFAGRKAFAGFDGGSQQTMEYIAPASFTRYRHFISLATPDTGFFPGRSSLGAGLRSFESGSGLKAAWLMLSANGNTTGGGEADIALPTHIGNGNLSASGNSVSLSFFQYSGSSDDYWSWNEFNGFGFVSPADLNNPKTVGVPMELSMTSAKIGTLFKSKTIGAFAGTDDTVTDANAAFDRISFNAYARDAEGSAQIYYTDLYLAIESTPGANDFVQCLFLGNAATVAACTVLRPLKADSWTDTEVSFTDPFGLSYYHIVKPDGSTVSGAI